MPKIEYIPRTFQGRILDTIETANRIIREYAAQGFDLTLRQLYYQFVARDIIPNKMTEYKRLGSIINDARLAGLIDWNAITDRTRNVRSRAHWGSPRDIIESCAQQFHVDMWAGQGYRPEVWIEKDALVGVINDVCHKWDVPFFACRGYTSQSEMWRAGQRMERHRRDGHVPFIIHLGDHDPSGVDMTRDIDERMELFMGGAMEVNRVALNMDQINEYKPPPNPAKITDSRAGGYIVRHGTNSWELDALEPQVIVDLVDTTIRGILDRPAWDEMMTERDRHRANIQAVADRWDDVVDHATEGE